MKPGDKVRLCVDRIRDAWTVDDLEIVEVTAVVKWPGGSTQIVPADALRLVADDPWKKGKP